MRGHTFDILTFKTIVVIFLQFLLLNPFVNVSGQGYTLNFKDPSTYTTTCGSVNPAQWEVRNDSCILYTPVFYPNEGAGDSVVVSFTIRINQSGNLESNDNAYIHHQINSGNWTLNKKYNGDSATSVFTYIDSMKVARTDNFRFKITLQNNADNEFWQIKDGNIQVSDVHYSDLLPVEFLYVKATNDNDHVDIFWSTASETDNDFFTVEKSSDAVDFVPVTTVKGAGNSNTIIEYQYEDMSPYAGVSYYRIKQTDFDGKFDYSEIRAVKFLLPLLSDFLVYPNPVKSGEILQIIPGNNMDVSYTISVYALNGQKVAEFNTDGAFSFLINASLNKGVYFLVISSGEERLSEKIVIQ